MTDGGVQVRLLAAHDPVAMASLQRCLVVARLGGSTPNPLHLHFFGILGPPKRRRKQKWDLPQKAAGKEEEEQTVPVETGPSPRGAERQAEHRGCRQKRGGGQVSVRAERPPVAVFFPPGSPVAAVFHELYPKSQQ